MSFRRPFGYDPLTGKKQTFVINDDKTFSIETETDIEPILRANYEAKKVAPTKWGSWDKPGEAFTHYGSIPMGVYMSLPRDIRCDAREVTKWLQKSDNEVFRVRGGMFL